MNHENQLSCLILLAVCDDGRPTGTSTSTRALLHSSK
jgi:hypothetical protein